MATDPFDSPKKKLARAQKDLRDFEEVSKAFSDSAPYAPITELDEDGVTTLHKIS